MAQYDITRPQWVNLDVQTYDDYTNIISLDIVSQTMLDMCSVTILTQEISLHLWYYESHRAHMFTFNIVFIYSLTSCVLDTQ